MIAHEPQRLWTGRSEQLIDDRRHMGLIASVLKRENHGPRSAWTVLSDPAIEVAFLQTSREGIVHRGWGNDWADVAGNNECAGRPLRAMDRIESLDHILKISNRCVAERVRAGEIGRAEADIHCSRHYPRTRACRKFADASCSSASSQEWTSAAPSVRRKHRTFVRDGWIIKPPAWLSDGSLA